MKLPNAGQNTQQQPKNVCLFQSLVTQSIKIADLLTHNLLHTHTHTDKIEYDDRGIMGDKSWYYIQPIFCEQWSLLIAAIID